MKTLSHIIHGLSLLEIIGDSDLLIAALVFDSRQANADSLFFAIPGTQADGHRFIPAVIQQGCRAIVCEQLPAECPPHITFIRVAQSARALGECAAAFYGHPSAKLCLVGITGTNGKTSVATLLYRLFSGLGNRCGLISTVENRIADEVVPSTHTTPDPVTLNALLAQMVTAGCSYAFMEVSSHAVVQQRIAGLQFAGGVFTNITHDHLDYHKTFDQYIRAKKGFFDLLTPQAFALVNADDRNGLVMVQNARSRCYTYALRTMADFHARVIESGIQGLHLQIGGKDLYSLLIGQFNAYNILAVYAVSVLLEADKEESLRIISGIMPPTGRFDRITSPGGITGIVDYAHTPDALKNVLQTIQSLRKGNEQLITLVGCGGDRDAAKRPEMAAIAVHFSQQVILTADNPRSEDPEAILSQMEVGIPADQKRKVLRLSDRREAIRTACRLAAPGDIILLAGKGHETYQEINGVKYPFDDKLILHETLLELNK